MKLVKIFAAAVLGCLLLTGCSGAQKTKLPAYSFGTQNQSPIITSSVSKKPITEITNVYVTIFDNIAFLAQTPVLEYGDAEMIGIPRNISGGGTIGCEDEDGNPVEITAVVIKESLTPHSMKDWFRDLTHLTVIQGLEQINTDHVTDMSHTFSGCIRLSQLNADGWNTAKVTDMTGIFDGCDALTQKPVWYEEN